MNSGMKMLTLFVLLCAGMLLTNAAAVPEAEPDQITEEKKEVEVVEEASVQGGELLSLTDPESDLHEETTEEETNVQEADVVVSSATCPYGWSHFDGRCFLFNASPKPWAFAEKNCRTQGATLVSVRSYAEDRFVKSLIRRITNRSQPSWVGGSDAQHEGVWLWTDGSLFYYTNWCRGEPSNGGGKQHCLLLNYDGWNCWHDLNCRDYYPYVCVKRL